MSMDDVQLEQLKMLRSIDSTLKQLLELSRARKGAAPAAGKSQDVAPASDLDSQYGDPQIAFEPRDWAGAPQKGKRFSEAPPEFLDVLAEVLDYFAEKAEKEGTLSSSGKPTAPYKRKDAARARGWAARLRSGWKPPQAAIEGEPEW